ncbi:MAG TPA: helix-turn-helix domain-containing protein, partial [Candidatus Obscuribacter sp.]|nr:helix-turn-helix domain-containing protein [Candidatus Obscuribacter sp.]
MGRNYEQACPVAKALELLGERWTLLIVRDLILGRSKFNELQESLPGITASVLSERLKNLEKEG